MGTKLALSRNVVVCSLLASPVAAQTLWTQRTVAVAPSPRMDAAMAFDSGRGRVVLFGGWVLNNVSSETWEWDGTAWTKRAPATIPQGRFRHAMAYDAARGRVVMYGGAMGPALELYDTWEWDGTDWARRQTPPMPGRAGHAMVHDPVRGRVLMFGGFGPVGPYDDTSEWDGATWTTLLLGAHPSARFGHAMVHDAARVRTVLFGGLGGALSGDTWEWDGSAWSQRSPAASPQARYGHGMVYDSARGRTVLFGGTDGSGELAGSWEWDGTAWQVRAVAAEPGARQGAAMAFDPARGRTVLFGGGFGTRPSVLLGDTWEYAAAMPASAVPFGTGCPTGSAPRLGTDRGSLPWLGDTWAVRADGIGGNPFLNVPFLILGDSRTAWGTWPLPLDLSFLGMAGCTAYTNALVALPLVNAAGSATAAIPIPSAPSLAGARVYVQAGATAPGANAFGVVLANALEATLGAR